MQRDHVPGVVALQASCFPPPFPADLLWTSSHLQRHLELFAEGQFVALAGNQVIGSASALRIGESAWQRHADWETTTGGHFFTSHDPQGGTLYAADISVHPDERGLGVGRALYSARFELVRRLKMDRVGTACRISGFRNWNLRTGQSVSQYAEAVQLNEVQDRTLTPLLKYGMMAIGVIENYMEDEESAGAAALLEWRP